MRQRSVNFHRFPGDIALLLRVHRAERAHIVQTVGELDDQHTDILVGGHEHPAHILRLMLLLGVEAELAQLGQTVDDLRGGVAEGSADIIQRHRGVLHHVVKKSGNHTFGVHTERHKNIGHGNRVNDIGFARLALLTGMSLVGEKISLFYQRHIVFLAAVQDIGHQFIIRLILFHYIIGKISLIHICSSDIVLLVCHMVIPLLKAGFFCLSKNILLRACSVSLHARLACIFSAIFCQNPR